MKKLFAIVLAVVMVMGIATSAMAFTWSKPADSDKIDFGYTVDVIKFTRSTAALGSSSFNADDNATAVNGADVYYTIKLTVASPSDEVKAVNPQLNVKVTALSTAGEVNVPVPTANGVYYFEPASGALLTVDQFVQNTLGNKVAETPVVAATCLDTDTAKVYAKVTAKTAFGAGNWINCGEYSVEVTDTTVSFSKVAGEVLAVFTRDGNGKVTAVADNGKTQDVAALYAWLNAGSVDAIYTAIKNGEMYMTNDNLHAAFGFNFKSEDSITWNANSTPIILDPTVSIPKTGDSASVVGFAMIMVAIVAAAVAVKKVNA